MMDEEEMKSPRPPPAVDEISLENTPRDTSVVPLHDAKEEKKDVRVINIQYPQKLKDKLNIVLIGFCILGCALSLPFSSIHILLKTLQLHFAERNVLVAYTMAYIWFYEITFFLAIKFTNPKYKERRLVIGAASLSLLVMPFFFINSYSLDLGFILFLSLLAFIGITQAVVESALYELASNFLSPKHINGIQIGKEISNLIALIIYSAYNTVDQKEEKLFLILIVYMSFTILCIFVAGGYYLLIMKRQTYWDYYVHVLSLDEDPDQYPGEVKEDILKDTDEEELDNQPKLYSTRAPPNPSALAEQDVGWLKFYINLISVLWKPMVGCASVYLLTFCIYPYPTGLLSRIHPANPALTSNDWFPIILTFIFLLFSLIGKLLLREKYFVKVTSKSIYILVLLRLLFLPLWILSVHPRIFRHEVFPVVFAIFFGLTNGFCGTYMMMYGPSTVDFKKDRAAVAMAWTQSFGVALGLSLSFVFGLI